MGELVAEWIDSLAEALGVDPLTAEETQRLLAASREVAHRAERRITPLSTFLLGMGVSERMSNGASREDAFEEALHEALDLLPPGAAERQNEQTE
jgi:hypothetical protein